MKVTLKGLIVGGMLVATTSAWGAEFVSNDDGTITDTNTGIEWAADASSPTVNTCRGGDMSWEAAQKYVGCLNDAEYLGNDDWRLPTLDEFVAVSGHLGLATGVEKKAYWTATETAGTTEAFAFKAKAGVPVQLDKKRNLPIWVVRSAGSTIELPPAKSADRATVVVKYNVQVSAGLNGAITPVGLTGVKSGTKKTFTVKPAKGFMISAVTVNGAPVSLEGKSLTKPLKVAVIVTGDTTIAATFSDAPKVSSFPTNLPAGTYNMGVSYCASAGGYKQCQDLYNYSFPFSAGEVNLFIDYFNTYFDDILETYTSQYSCKSKSGCTKFDGSDFTCTTSLTCKIYGYSVTSKVNYIFTLQ